MRKSTLWLLSLALTALSIPYAHAQVQKGASAVQDKFPTKPIRLVVPFPAGGTVDGVARTLGPELAAATGQTVVIENRGGAGGSIGAGLVAQSEPDGYTLLLALDTHALNPLVYPNLPYDTARDFTPISLLARAPMVAVATNGFAANTVPELVSLAKKAPGELNFASVGAGSASHLTGELFNQQAGVSMVHVPYRGGSPAMTDLIGGQVQIMWGTVPYVQSMVKSGKIKALGQTGEQRSHVFPELKTLTEQGLEGVGVYGWVGILGPAGMAPERLDYWQKTLAAVVRGDKVSTRLKNDGFDVVASSPEEFGQFVQSEQEKWGKLITARNLKLQ